jgi:hypothetical protein
MIDDDDHDENVVVKIPVLVNELWLVMIVSYYDYLMNDVMRMMMMKTKKMILMKIDDDDDEVLEND